MQGLFIQPYTTDIPNLIIDPGNNLKKQKSNIQKHTTYVLQSMLLYQQETMSKEKNNAFLILSKSLDSIC